jgi:hypothetical protein
MRICSVLIRPMEVLLQLPRIRDMHLEITHMHQDPLWNKGRGMIHSHSRPTSPAHLGNLQEARTNLVSPWILDSRPRHSALPASTTRTPHNRYIRHLHQVCNQRRPSTPRRALRRTSCLHHTHRIHTMPPRLVNKPCPVHRISQRLSSITSKSTPMDTNHHPHKHLPASTHCLNSKALVTNPNHLGMIHHRQGTNHQHTSPTSPRRIHGMGRSRLLRTRNQRRSHSWMMTMTMKSFAKLPS